SRVIAPRRTSRAQDDARQGALAARRDVDHARDPVKPLGECGLDRSGHRLSRLAAPDDGNSAPAFARSGYFWRRSIKKLAQEALRIGRVNGGLPDIAGVSARNGHDDLEQDSTVRVSFHFDHLRPTSRGSSDFLRASKIPDLFSRPPGIILIAGEELVAGRP